MKLSVIPKSAVPRRAYWIDEIVKISDRFGKDTARVEEELATEIKRDGTQALLDHLRLCGAIPEHYGHDSSEEKLYSKYTDAILSAALNHIGLNSIVLTERADAADVEAVGKDYSLVGDAKVFRLSRTAKNQKDFKIDAMHGWKRGKPHALIVCPIYQLPTRQSQIYQQAVARNVCVYTYAHLSVLVNFSDIVAKKKAQDLLLRVLNCAEAMNPTKDALTYWTSVNRSMIGYHREVQELWSSEKVATVESIALAKEEALTMLARQRENILRMSHSEAVQALVKRENLSGRESAIRKVCDNQIFTIS